MTKANPMEHERYERRAHAMIATMAEAGETPQPDRRARGRQRFLAATRMNRATAYDAAGRTLTLYARDLNADTMGFIAAGDLTADTHGTVELPGPGGQPMRAEGRIVRTHTFADGWHEGYVRFDRPIPLAPTHPFRRA